jgi:hypothetical protein
MRLASAIFVYPWVLPISLPTVCSPTVIRIIAASRGPSLAAYSFDDNSGDTSFSKFNINNAPPYLLSVLKDIKAINSGKYNFNLLFFGDLTQ